LTDFAIPTLWGPDQLDEDIATAIENFRQERYSESADLYPGFFEKVQADLETLLEQTIDLSTLADTAQEVLKSPKLTEALRYVAAPPISADDLKTLVDATSTKQFCGDVVSKRIVETIQATLDKHRFPWVLERREPNPEEKNAAIIASAALMATRQIETYRRNQAQKLQEEAVKAALSAHGFIEVPRRLIRTGKDAPGPGEFCGESKLGARDPRKADIVVGLWDSRIMPIECKVSNSAINSVKRLNNDAAAKAGFWREHFGDFVTSVAVISGVFKRLNIEGAQKSGLMIIWAHRLSDLTDFIDRTK
jgi:hypothetical protein